MSAVHTFDREADRCTCGGMWDYIEPSADSGLPAGYACETSDRGYAWATTFSGSSDPVESLRRHPIAGPAIRRATAALERGDGPDVAFEKVLEGAESIHQQHPLSDERFDQLIDAMGDAAGIS